MINTCKTTYVMRLINFFNNELVSMFGLFYHYEPKLIYTDTLGEEYITSDRSMRTHHRAL